MVKKFHESPTNSEAKVGLNAATNDSLMKKNNNIETTTFHTYHS